MGSQTKAILFPLFVPRQTKKLFANRAASTSVKASNGAAQPDLKANQNKLSCPRVSWQTKKLLTNQADSASAKARAAQLDLNANQG